jgi:hypothetical protein
MLDNKILSEWSFISSLSLGSGDDSQDLSYRVAQGVSRWKIGDYPGGSGYNTKACGP